jgi:hypothetical protein
MTRLKIGTEEVGDSSKQAETEITIYAKIGDFNGLSQADEMLHQIQAGVTGPGGKVRVRAETRGGVTTYTETIKTQADNENDSLHAMIEMTAEIGKEYFDAFVMMAGGATVKDRYDFKVKKIEGLAVMMLDYMGWKEAGELITKTMETLFTEGYATNDLARFMNNGKPMGSKEFGDKLIAEL